MALSIRVIIAMTPCILSGVIGCAASLRNGPADDLVGPELRRDLTNYLSDIDQWVMTLDVGNNVLKATKDTTTSIFINGNFARLLIASYRITGNQRYLKEALRWCDTFCSIQHLAITSTIQDGGFWTDCGYGRNIYFGDAGTAASALAIAYHYADDHRKAIYLAAMERYARFVTQGSINDPQGMGRQYAGGWVISEGEDRGALGCGYYKGHLSLAPYTISTATTGMSFFSSLYSITGRSQYRDIAMNAAGYLLKVRKDEGEIPYILDGTTETIWPLDTMAYCGEGFVAADLNLKNPGLHKRLARELRPCVDWLLRSQNPDGSWGRLRSADQQRSPRAVALLTWSYRRVEADPKIAESIRRYCRYLLDPQNSKAYGVKELVRTTGFVGLTVAEIILPGSTF